MAIGGGRKRKGLRTIKVEGAEYYWRVLNDDRASMRDGKLIVTIGEVRRPHRRVTLTGRGLSFWWGKPGVLIFCHSDVTPRLVREAILFAGANGWPEHRPAIGISCDADKKFSVQKGS